MMPMVIATLISLGLWGRVVLRASADFDSGCQHVFASAECKLQFFAARRRAIEAMSKQPPHFEHAHVQKACSDAADLLRKWYTKLQSGSDLKESWVVAVVEGSSSR